MCAKFNVHNSYGLLAASNQDQKHEKKKNDPVKNELELLQGKCRHINGKTINICF